MSINGNSQYSKIKLPRFNYKTKKNDVHKLNINVNNNNKYERTSSEGILFKKENLKKVSFFSPNMKSKRSDDNLKLHLYLYDTFKKFGEAHSGNVIKNIKKLKY